MKGCRIIILSLSVTLFPSGGGLHGAAMLTPADAEALVGACNSAICETWWCPWGTEHQVQCEGDPCALGVPPGGDNCACSLYPESVSRVASESGGDDFIMGLHECGVQLECECRDSEGGYRCVELPVPYGPAGTYTKCVVVP